MTALPGQISMSGIAGFSNIECHIVFSNDTAGEILLIFSQSFLFLIFSAGYHARKDTTKTEVILNALRRGSKCNLLVYTSDHQSLAYGGNIWFDYD